MSASEQQAAAAPPAPVEEGALSHQLEELRRELAGAGVADGVLRRLEVVTAIGAAYDDQLRSVRRNLRQLEDLFLPVCMFCKRVRTDDSYWERIERFFARNADITFSHGVCPSCFDERLGLAGAPPPAAAPGATPAGAGLAPAAPDERPAPARRADGSDDEALRALRALAASAEAEGSPLGPALQQGVERVARTLARYRKVVEISDGYQEEFRGRLERAVRSDGLTGFATRAAAFEAIEDAFERARGGGGGPAPALVIVEVRGLREVNRRHGHEIGDRALVALSRTLRKSAAVARLRARWSGAAFALVVDAQGADRLVARVLAAMRAVVVKHGAAELSLEIEAGLALAGAAADAGAWITAAEEAVTAGPAAAPAVTAR